MQSYLVRLSSFAGWKSQLSSLPLAKSGFYYQNNRDEVTCFSCGVKVDRWEKGQDVQTRHKQLSPSCLLLDNVPSSVQHKVGNAVETQIGGKPAILPSGSTATDISGLDHCDNHTSLNSSYTDQKRLERDSDHNRYSPTSMTLPNTDQTAFNDTRPTDSVKSIYTTSNSSTVAPQTRFTDVDARSTDWNSHPAIANLKHPEYMEEELRRMSFARGIAPRGQSAPVLAKAGFYYVGPRDQTRCFCCGGELKNWEREDDPFEEHRKWFPRCSYIQHYDRSVGMFPVEPREVKARMETARVQTLLEMGYPRDLIRRTIEARLAMTGDDFSNIQSLLDEVMNVQEQRSGFDPLSQLRGDTVVQPSMAPNQQSTLVDYQTTNLSAASATLSNELSGAAAMSTASDANSTASKSKEKKKKKNKSGVNSSDIFNKEINEDRTQDEELTDPDELQILEANKTLEARVCKVCTENEVNTIFLPCGHLVCCSNCAPKIRNCAICRALIKGIVRVFLSWKIQIY